MGNSSSRKSRNSSSKNPSSTTSSRQPTQQSHPSSMGPESPHNPSPYTWYWQDDDGSWKRYDGSSGSITSDVIEKSYQKKPNGSLTFSLKNCSYVIDFASYTQLNKNTGKKRNVERRSAQYTWYWQDDNGQWKEYDSIVSSILITESYHNNNANGFRFTRNGCSYIIDFKEMKQKNEATGMSRSVKRELLNPLSRPLPSPPPTASRSHDWYWQDDNKEWHLFDGEISSDYIEIKFSANPKGNFTFEKGGCLNQIDLQEMIQTNKSTGKQHRIDRTPKGVAPPPAVKNNPEAHKYIQISPP